MSLLVSELAERADVPLATVKYYLREGLLPAGETTGPRRAEYDEAHLRRLRVLRLLREVGEVPVTSLRRIVEAMDDSTLPVHDAMTLIADVISAGPTPGHQDEAALQMVDDLFDSLGWDAIRPESVDRLRLAGLVSLLNGPGPLGANGEVLRYYAGIADDLAKTEISMVDHSVERSTLLEDMVAGSVVYGQVFELLRQLGHEQHHARATERVTRHEARQPAPQPDQQPAWHVEV